MPPTPFIALAAASATAAAAGFGDAPAFTDVTSDWDLLGQVTADGMAAGAAIADADGDGDHDLYVPAGIGEPNRFYRNDGDGVLTDVAAELGLARTTSNDRGALFFDYDGDHDLDLLVGADDHAHFDPVAPSTLALYRREADGTYVDVTEDAGLFGQIYEHGEEFLNHLSGLVAGDLNGDGWLDLLQTHWRGNVLLYINQGDGTFVDEAGPRGVGDRWDTYWQPMLCDFDGDGALDIFCAVDFTWNLFYANDGSGTFTELGVALGIDNEGGNDMGVALGDADADGDLDLYVTNIFGPKYDQNHLWRNDSAPGAFAFTDVTDEAGVADSDWGWGATFADVDHDGRSDLFVTNGYFGFEDSTRLFHQQSTDPPVFIDVAAEAGVLDSGWGGAMLAADLDGDLDLDAVQVRLDEGAPPRVWRNDCDAAAHAVVIRPRMEGRNHFAIGATVRVVTPAADGWHTQARGITAGTSMLGQEPADAHFGLASEAIADRVEIVWPGGGETVLHDVVADRVVTVMRWSCPGDVDDSGAVDSADLTLMLAAWGDEGVQRADANGDGVVDVADLLTALSAWGTCTAK